MFVSIPVWGESFYRTDIYDVDYGFPGEEILVLLGNGRVAKINPEKTDYLSILTESKRMKKEVAITLDKDRYIVSIEFLPNSTHTGFFPKETNEALNTYIPTTVANMSTAQKYHNKGRHSPKESQCFNRALVWSYEWYKDHSLKSMHMFVFFTRNYIRRYNFEWWWHIAPYVHVMHDGKVVERLMDIKYTKGPVTVQQWTNIFMRNDAQCRVVTKYSDYADHPYTGDCYLMRTSMYFYQPSELQMNESWGFTKNNFVRDQLKEAYREAFNISF
jgi:hypothetical protein